MISLSDAVLGKINNPIQLPSNGGDPRIGFYITNGSGSGSINWSYGDLIKNGTITSKLEDYAYNCSLTFMRGDIEISEIDNLWVPGSRVYVYVGFGTNVLGLGAFCIFGGHIDEVNFDSNAEEFSVSASGSIYHCLKESSMDETTTLTGLSHEVTASIMEIAGVTNYYATVGIYEWTYTYKPTDDCLTALEQMYPIFPKDGNEQPGFGIISGPTDRIIFGYWRHRVDAQYGGIPVGNYYFNLETDAFSRSVRMNSDKCYSKVRATGKAADGVDLTPYTVDVLNFQSWNIPPNKIYHAEFNGYTMQDNLEDWANTIALELQHQGITNEISGPFRPQLTVGDIAYMTVGGTFTSNGVITSITHHLGLDGFKTDFSIDSSGVQIATSGWSSNVKWYGYNRRQKLAEIVKEIADETTEYRLNQFDNVSVQDAWDSEEEEELDLTPERNKMLIEYLGWNRQIFEPDDGEVL